MPTRLAAILGLLTLVCPGRPDQVCAFGPISDHQYWLAVRKKVIADHNQLVGQFSDWKGAVLRYTQRLEKGPDKEKIVARVCRDALDHVKTSSLETKMAQLKDQLKNLATFEEKKVEKARQLSRAVAGELDTLKGILQMDRLAAQFRRERLEFRVLFTKLEKLISDQKNARRLTNEAKTGRDKLRRSHRDLADESAKLSQVIKDREHAVAKLLQDAARYQKEAEKKLTGKGTKAVLSQQDQALKQLALAKTQFLSYQKQRGEEAIGYLCLTLVERCKNLLDYQRKIRTATLRIDKAINNFKGKKPARSHKEAAARLSRKEKTLIREATRAILVLEADGSAIAFAEVFKQVRADMETVQKLLAECKVGKEAQAIEQDIVETFEDMVKALEKERKTRKSRTPSFPKFQETPGKKMTKLLDQLKGLEEGYRSKVQSALLGSIRYFSSGPHKSLEDRK
jgi:hypothetical protein